MYPIPFCVKLYVALWLSCGRDVAGSEAANTLLSTEQSRHQSSQAQRKSRRWMEAGCKATFREAGRFGRSKQLK